MTRRHQTPIVAALLSVLLVVTGCSAFGPDALPTPQSFRSGWTLDVQLTTVLNLPPQARVQVDGADAGVLRSVKVHPGFVTVRITLDRGVRVATTAHAVVRQDTLLGDTYVAIDNPSDPGAALPTIRDSGTLPLSAARQPVQIEDLLHDLADFLGSGSLAQLGSTVQNINSRFPSDPDAVRTAQRPLLQIIAAFADDTHSGNAVLENLAAASDHLASQQRSLASLLSHDGSEAFGAAIDSVAGYADIVSTLSTALKPSLPLAPALASLGDVVTSVILPFLVPGWPDFHGQQSTASNLEELLRTKLIPFLQHSPAVNVRTLMTSSGLSDTDIAAQTVRTLRMLGLTR